MLDILRRIGFVFVDTGLRPDSWKLCSHLTRCFRKKFAEKVFEVASSDLVNMGITVVSYTLKDVHDDENYLKSLGLGRFLLGFLLLHFCTTAIAL